MSRPMSPRTQALAQARLDAPSVPRVWHARRPSRMRWPRAGRPTALLALAAAAAAAFGAHVAAAQAQSADAPAAAPLANAPPARAGTVVPVLATVPVNPRTSASPRPLGIRDPHRMPARRARRAHAVAGRHHRRRRHGASSERCARRATCPGPNRRARRFQLLAAPPPLLVRRRSPPLVVVPARARFQDCRTQGPTAVGGPHASGVPSTATPRSVDQRTASDPGERGGYTARLAARARGRP